MTMHDWMKTHRDEILALPTPCYVHSKQLLDDHLKMVAQHLGQQVELIYSVKANPHPQLLALVQNHVAGFDVSSLRETEQVAPYSSRSKISFVGPAKTLADNIRFLEMIPNGLIVVESKEELAELQEWSSKNSRSFDVCLRVDLVNKVGPQGKAVSEPLQFGVSPEEALSLTRAWPNPSPIRLLGFHFHSFSQHRDHESLLRHFTAGEDFLRQIAAQGFSAKLINFGSGLSLPYFDQALPFDLTAFRAGLTPLLERVRQRMDPAGNIHMESGRYLVGGSGLFVARVIRKKRRGEQTFLILDGGFAQNAMITGVHMPLRRNFKHHLLKVNPSDSTELSEYSAFGPSCSVNDVVLQKTKLPEVEVGDRIWFENMGAYGKSFSPTGFLSFDEPGEFFL